MGQGASSLMGPPGPPGLPGPQGKPGISIDKLEIRDGFLYAKLSDGSEKNVGAAAGPPGDPGKGIKSVGLKDGKLIIKYTDNTETPIAIKELGESSLSTKTLWCADGKKCNFPKTVKEINFLGLNMTNVNHISPTVNHDWMRIDSSKTRNGIAMYGGVSINDGGGLSIGGWERQSKGVLKIHAPGAQDGNDGKIVAGNHWGRKGLQITGHKAGGTGRQTIIHGDLVVTGKVTIEAPGGNVIRYNDNVAIQHYRGRGALQAANGWDARTSSNPNGDWEKWKITKR